jgi:hypothetical protein
MSKENGSTHWENCATEGGYRHYACAVAEIERLRLALAEAQETGDGYEMNATGQVVVPALTVEAWDGNVNIVMEGAPPSLLTGYEFVKHPAHYNRHPAGVECITVIEPMSFNVGTAIKHLWRAGLKPGADHVTDLRTAITYIEFEIARITRAAQ